MKIAKEDKSFFWILDGLNELIDTNICHQFVEDQLKSDASNCKKMVLQPKMNVILRKDTIKSDLAQFHQYALFSPVTSTLAHAVNSNNFITWPGLTPNLMKKTSNSIHAYFERASKSGTPRPTIYKTSKNV